MTEPNPEWTVSTLKQLSDERELHARELRAADKELRAADREAVAVAQQAQKEQRAEDKRAEELWRQTTNEARGQLKDQAATFITREAFEATLRNLTGDRLSGRTDARGTVVMIVGIVGGALGVVAFALSIFLNFGLV